MKVLVIYINRSGDQGDFEYISKFDRINAKGIRDEARKEMFKKYGNEARHMYVEYLYRQD